MKIMMWTMPLFSVYIEFQMAAAIGVYWIFRNILSVVERMIYMKLYPIPKFTEEDYKAAEAAMNVKEKKGKKSGGNKAPVRSLHHIDDEEYLARQEQKAAALAAEEEKKAEEQANADENESNEKQNKPKDKPKMKD